MINFTDEEITVILISLKIIFSLLTLDFFIILTAICSPVEIDVPTYIFEKEPFPIDFFCIL